MMRVLLTGYAIDLVQKLNRLMPARSLVILEEKGIYDRRGLDRAEVPACVEEVIFADYIQADSYREEVGSAARRRPFDGIFVGTEYSICAAADLAQSYGLPGATPAAASRFTDKIALRLAAAAGGVPGPRWAEVAGLDDLERFAADCAGDFVLKPADRSASYGVSILRHGDDIGQAWAALTQIDPDPLSCTRPLRHRYLVEERLLGPEFSVECLVRDGTLIFSNVTSKLVWPGRYPVEQGHEVPALVAADTERALVEAMQRLSTAAGFGTGFLHGEWIVTPAGPALVECAARAPGDNIVDLIDFAYGTDMIGALLDLFCGREVTPPGAAVSSAAVRFLRSAPGRIRRVQGVLEAESVPGVRRVMMRAPGTEVQSFGSSWDRIGYVLAAGPDAASVASRAAGLIRVITR